MNNLQSKAPILFQIAEFVQSNKHFINAETLHQAKRVSADTIGVAFSGIKTEAFKLAIENLDELFGKGINTIWGTSIKTTLLGASFFNTLSISSTDFDEGHRKAVGHPASMVVPVAFTMGKSLNCSYDKVLKAIIIGYEIATRFSQARISSKIDTYSSGRWGTVGAATAAAYLLDLDTEKTMHALSNSWILSPTMIGGSTDVSTGSMSKEGVAWATQSGLQSVLLAEKSFVGPYLFIDDHDDFEKEKLTENLGHSWLINSNYFKPYACCRWLHAAVNACEIIKLENDFKINDVKHIEIEVFGRAINLVGGKYPEYPIQAQFHLPFVIACMLEYGHVLPEHFCEENLYNKNIKELINKTVLLEKERYNKVFPEKLPSSVTIKTERNTFNEEVLTAPWDADCQPSDSELFEKFILLAGKEHQNIWAFLFSESIESLKSLTLF